MFRRGPRKPRPSASAAATPPPRGILKPKRPLGEEAVPNTIAKSVAFERFLLDRRSEVKYINLPPEYNPELASGWPSLFPDPVDTRARVPSRPPTAFGSANTASPSSIVADVESRSLYLTESCFSETPPFPLYSEPEGEYPYYSTDANRRAGDPAILAAIEASTIDYPDSTNSDYSSDFSLDDIMERSSGYSSEAGDGAAGSGPSSGFDYTSNATRDFALDTNAKVPKSRSSRSDMMSPSTPEPRGPSRIPHPSGSTNAGNSATTSIPRGPTMASAASRVNIARPAARRPAFAGLTSSSGSPMSRRSFTSFNTLKGSSSPSIRLNVGPTVRVAPDAHRVIMGRHKIPPPSVSMNQLPHTVSQSSSVNFPSRTSSLQSTPESARKTGVPPTSVYDRLSRPTVASNARATDSKTDLLATIDKEPQEKENTKVLIDQKATASVNGTVKPSEPASISSKAINSKSSANGTSKPSDNTSISKNATNTSTRRPRASLPGRLTRSTTASNFRQGFRTRMSTSFSFMSSRRRNELSASTSALSTGHTLLQNFEDVEEATMTTETITEYEPLTEDNPTAQASPQAQENSATQEKSLTQDDPNTRSITPEDKTQEVKEPLATLHESDVESTVDSIARPDDRRASVNLTTFRNSGLGSQDSDNDSLRVPDTPATTSNVDWASSVPTLTPPASRDGPPTTSLAAGQTTPFTASAPIISITKASNSPASVVQSPIESVNPPTTTYTDASTNTDPAFTAPLVTAAHPIEVFYTTLITRITAEITSALQAQQARRQPLADNVREELLAITMALGGALDAIEKARIEATRLVYEIERLLARLHGAI